LKTHILEINAILFKNANACDVGFPSAAWKYELRDMRPANLQPFCGI
jgi:hypothetical protein